MSIEEAIQRINEHITVHQLKEPHAVYITEALQMAIDALEILKCCDNQTHLCDSCANHFASCDGKNIIFGNGYGNDNVIACDKYEVKKPQIDGDAISRKSVLEKIHEGFERDPAEFEWTDATSIIYREPVIEINPNTTFTVLDKSTNKEANPYEIALNEDWAKNLIYCDIEGFAILENGTLILTDECGNYACPPLDRFVVRWDEGTVGI